MLLGGSPISAVGLANKIASEFRIACPPSIIVEHSKLSELASYIDRERSKAPKNSPQSRCIIPQTRIDPDKPTIVLVHAVGGTVFCYRPFADYWGDEFNIVTVQAPDNSRLKSITSLSALAEIYSEQIAYYLLANQLHETDWFLGGWSLGGVLAGEVARYLTLRNNLSLPNRVLMLDSYCQDDNNSGRNNITERQLAVLFFEDFLQRVGLRESIQDLVPKNTENLFSALYRYCSNEGYLKKQEENGLTEQLACNQYKLFAHLYRLLLSHTPAKLCLPTCYIKATECSAEHFPGLVPFKTKEDYFHYMEVEANHQSIIDVRKIPFIHESFLMPIAGKLEGT